MNFNVPTAATPGLKPKLSDNLRDAIADARLLLQRPDFHLDMNAWYRSSERASGDNYCTACLGGAIVLARYPQFVRNGAGGRIDFLAMEVKGYLQLTTLVDALDSIRTGHVGHAIRFYYGIRNEDLRTMLGTTSRETLMSQLDYVRHSTTQEEAFFTYLENVVLLLKANML